jgi:hypothetical protein
VLTGVVVGDAVATLFIFLQIRSRLPAKATAVHAIVLALPVAATSALALSDGGGALWVRGLVFLLAMIPIGLDLVVGQRIHPIGEASPGPVPAS